MKEVLAESNQLVDIDINDEKQEMIMAIDTHFVREDYIFFGLFYLIFLSLTIFTHKQGPPIYYQANPIPFSLPFEHLLNGFSPKITYLSLFIVFPINKSQTFGSDRLQFSYSLYFRQNSDEVRKELGIRDDLINSLPRSKSGHEIVVPLYFDREIYFNSVRTHFFPMQNCTFPLTNGTVIWEIGNPNYTIFEFWIRFIYIIFDIIIVCYYFLQIKHFPMKIWSFEQKLTIVLQIIAFLAANPFYFTMLHSQTTFQIYFNTFLFQFSKSFILFFILCIIDQIRFANDRIKKCFFIPKIIYFFVHLFVQVFNYVMDNNISSYLSLSVLIVFTLWFSYLIFSLYKESDSTQFHKITYYTVIFLLVLIVEFIDPILSITFRDTGIKFMIDFSSQLFVVVLMTYAHFPYDFSFDFTSYTETDKQNENQGQIFEEDDQI